MFLAMEIEGLIQGHSKHRKLKNSLAALLFYSLITRLPCHILYSALMTEQKAVLFFLFM